LGDLIALILMFLLYNAIHKCSVIPIEIPRAFFTELDKRILKFLWTTKNLQIATTILSKNNKEGGSLTSKYTTKMQQSNSRVLA
jgi:hypothetical protein